MVLKRFLSGIAAFFNVERAAGVEGTLRVPGRLDTEGREVVVGVFRAGVAVAILEALVRSEVEGAKDNLLGLANMPSFFLSSLASTELSDVRFRCEGVDEGVVVEEGFLTVERPGRAGGLFKVVVEEVLGAELALGLARVDVRGATGLVKGLLGGAPVIGFSSVRDGTRSAILMTGGDCRALRKNTQAMQWKGQNEMRYIQICSRTRVNC
jgi:hypothetical protein